MSLSNRPISDITQQDLESLIQNKVLESKIIEYKRDKVGTNEDSKKEFLADVSSFANSSGGDIVFGVEEKNGIPANLIGISDSSPNDEILRLEQMARDGLNPSIIGITTEAVNLNNGKFALVMRIPRSWNPPHQVIYAKSFRFYGRSSNGKYQLDVDELRSVFLQTAGISEKIKQFRIERIAKIVADETPIRLQVGGKFVLHIIPLSKFTGSSVIDLFPLTINSLLMYSFMGGGSGSDQVHNVDGLWMSQAQSPKNRYAHIFRNGALELVAGGLEIRNAEPVVDALSLEPELITRISKGKELLDQLGVQPPFVISLSLIGLKGWRMRTQFNWSKGEFDRDPLLIPDILFEPSHIDLDHLFRSLFDSLWNAAGSARSPCYSADGKRITHAV